MTTTELVLAHTARLRAPMCTWPAQRPEKQYPSLVRTVGFVIDDNSTGVSAKWQRYRP